MHRKHTAVTDSDLLDSLDKIDTLVEKARLFVWTVATVFGLSFAFLLLKQIRFEAVLNSTPPHALTRVALVIYFNSWIFAQPIEQWLMRQVYVADPYNGRIPKSLLTVLPALTLLGFSLVLLRDNERLLSLALIAFFAVDMTLWLIIRSKATDMKRASEKIYNSSVPKQIIRLEQLKCYVDDYLRGNWQIYRFGAIAVYLFAFVALIHTDQPRQHLVTTLQHMTPAVPTAQIDALLPGALILSYVVLMESSAWIMRIRTRFVVQILNQLKAKYVLLPHP